MSALARWRIAALALAFLVCLYLGAIVRATRWTMDADESVHAIEGLRLFDDLAHGHVSDFLRHSYLPERWHPGVDEHLRWYPPLQAWSLVPAFALLGPSDFSARLPSLFFLFGFAWVVFELAVRLAQRGSAGFLAVLLCLTAPNVLTFSAQCMIEPAALFTCFLGLLLYLRSLERGHPLGRALTAGAALGLAVLTKFDHGGFLVLALGLTELLRVRASPARFLRSGAPALFGVVLAILVAWFAHPDKLAALGDSLRHPSYGTPRTILLDFSATWFTEYGASLAAGLLALAGFCACARRLREPEVRTVWSWALLATLFYALRGRFHFRYGIVEAPLYLLLAGVWLPEGLARAREVLAAPASAARRRLASVCAVACALALAAGLQVLRDPGSLYRALLAPFAWLHGLRADHWGMRLEPGAYVAYFEQRFPALASYLGGSLAALALGVGLLAALRALPRPPGKRAAGAALACALGFALLPGDVRLCARLPELVEHELECQPELNDVYAFTSEHVAAPATVLLGGGWDQLANNALRWYTLTRSLSHPAFDELTVVGDMIGSVVLPPEPRIAYWAERLARAPAAELPERIVLVTPGERFLYHTRFGPEVEIYCTLIEQRGSYRSLARRHFPVLDCEVEILARAGETAPVDSPAELLRRHHVIALRPDDSSRRWVSEQGWDFRDDALRHFMRRPAALDR